MMETIIFVEEARAEKNAAVIIFNEAETAFSAWKNEHGVEPENPIYQELKAELNRTHDNVIAANKSFDMALHVHFMGNETSSLDSTELAEPISKVVAILKPPPVMKFARMMLGKPPNTHHVSSHIPIQPNTVVNGVITCRFRCKTIVEIILATTSIFGIVNFSISSNRFILITTLFDLSGLFVFSFEELNAIALFSWVELLISLVELIMIWRQILHSYASTNLVGEMLLAITTAIVLVFYLTWIFCFFYCIEGHFNFLERKQQKAETHGEPDLEAPGELSPLI
jgi:hypothetical protein